MKSKIKIPLLILLLGCFCSVGFSLAAGQNESRPPYWTPESGKQGSGT